MKTVEQLEARLAEPSPELVAEIAALDGDLLILGAGGKIGPSLARLARNAVRRAGVTKRVIAVSRFSAPELVTDLEREGIEALAADLLDECQLRRLPDARNILFLVGTKFGTLGQEARTWTMNAYLPGRVAERFRDARFVVFSTGNVYPLTPVQLGGAAEEHATGPVGEYAQSCLGRERVFEYFSCRYGIPALLFRLNYAIDLRYGVLLEVAQAVHAGQPLDLRMGHVNAIWQGDVAELALRALALCAAPPAVLNVTGPETISVRWLAEQFGQRFGVEPLFLHEERETALLSNASRAHRLFGYPRVSLGQMIEWTAAWVKEGGSTLGKPSHFQEREGRF